MVFAMEEKDLNTSPELKAMAQAQHLAHEFNQPLTGIIGLTSLIMEDVEENWEHYETIQELDVQARRLQNLVQQFQRILQG